MSPLTAKPVLHGRDHCPGGADPIPCLQTGTGGSFEETVVAITDLYAYWRLGETGTPWADTAPVTGLAAADLVQQGSGTALTPDVPGALASGDDGALEFNYDGVSGTGGRFARAGGAGGGGIKNFDMPSTGKMTVAVWAKVKASALTRRGQIIGNLSWAVSGPGALAGWGIEVMYPSRKIRFTRGQPGGSTQPELYVETAGGMVAGDWNLFVGTYDGANIRLYVNSVLIGATADTSTAYSLGGTIQVGKGDDTAAAPAWFYGTVDEAAIWTRALTQTEIDQLYQSGVNTAATAGSRVLVSDGQGGFTWGQANGNAIQDEAIVNKHVAAAADINPTKLQHPGGTTDFLRADGTWATPVAGSPAADAQVWMPLTTVVSSVPELVWDASNSLIPTLTPI